VGTPFGGRDLDPSFTEQNRYNRNSIEPDTLYLNGDVCTNAPGWLRANRPALFTSTGAGGRKMRGGVLGLALVGLSSTGNDSFRAHQRGLDGTQLT